jgi:hypothetical protein
MRRGRGRLARHQGPARSVGHALLGRHSERDEPAGAHIFADDAAQLRASHKSRISGQGGIRTGRVRPWREPRSLYRSARGGSWPMTAATAAARHGRLLGVNLPAASPFVNPDSAHHGPRYEAGGASIIPPDATACAAIKGPPPSVRRFMPARCRAPRRAVPPARTDAGGALGREALDAAAVASGA